MAGGSVEASGFPMIPGLQFVAEIGRGSFGRVYKAVDTDNGRHVAVKVVAGAAVDEAALRQFDRERRAAGALSAHPNIVTVHRSGVDDAGRPFLVMELAPGRSLADRLRERGPIGPSDVAEIGVKLAGAVETAHRIDVVHCDIKPENILLGGSGEPLLADFGIARVAHAGSSSLGRAGTFAYSAPEVFKGERPSPSSDVFALGATLYALAAGSSPFMADPTSSQESVMYRIVTEEAPDLVAKGVPAPLAEVIETALRKDPAQRYPSAAALGQALQHAQGQLGERPTNLVVADVVVPDGPNGPELGSADPNGTVMLPAVGRSSGPLSSASALGRTRSKRRPAVLVAAAVAALAVLAGAVVAIGALTGGDDGGTELVAGAPDAKSTTTAGSATSASTAPASTAPPTTAAPKVTYHSLATDFLGTRVERDWELPEGQGQLTVTVTLFNISERAFRWHHDELVPASLTGGLAGVRSVPAPDATFVTEGVLRWWHELPPSGRKVISYTIDRQAAWPATVTTATLTGWDADRATATTGREDLILRSNNLTDRRSAPGIAPTVTTVAPAGGATGGGSTGGGATGGGATGGGSTGGGSTGGGSTGTTARPPVATVPAPVPPTVSISGPSQICAGERSTFTGSATGAVSGTWSLPNFTIFDPSWSPNEPSQWIEPGAGAVGGTFTWTLQVTSSAQLTASAKASFTVIDCNPAPTVSISGPSTVCLGTQGIFTGTAQGAQSGEWSLPGFNFNDASWSPGAPSQWVVPNQVGTFTWTLTVFSASGRSASAQKTFTVNC